MPHQKLATAGTHRGSEVIDSGEERARRVWARAGHVPPMLGARRHPRKGGWVEDVAAERATAAEPVVEGIVVQPQVMAMPDERGDDHDG